MHFNVHLKKDEYKECNLKKMKINSLSLHSLYNISIWIYFYPNTKKTIKRDAAFKKMVQSNRKILKRINLVRLRRRMHIKHLQILS